MNKTRQTRYHCRLVDRLAKWLMLISLMMIQAHAIVPHHHHDDGTPAHGHAAAHHAGFGHHADHGIELNGVHPEVSAHDEPSLSSVSQPNSPHFAFVLALPAHIEIVLPNSIVDRQRATFPSEHPYATGPPGTKPSRAPPSSLTA